MILIVLYINNFAELRSVSMGQGQEYHARRMIADAMNTGGWVLLQNTHLSLPFCTEAMDTLVEIDQIHESFRLWLTTEVHSQFPIGLLQVNIGPDDNNQIVLYTLTFLSDGYKIYKRTTSGYKSQLEKNLPRSNAGCIRL